jgi:hypothetical protein
MDIKPRDVVADKILVDVLVKKPSRLLATIYSHRFPIDLFPDKLHVEEGKVTIVKCKFFFTSEVYSVDIKNISNILINTAPLFAELVIVSNTFTKNEIRIKHLWIQQAIEIRKIIEGLRVLDKEGVDTSIFSKKDLISKLLEMNKSELV